MTGDHNLLAGAIDAFLIHGGDVVDDGQIARRHRMRSAAAVHVRLVAHSMLLLEIIQAFQRVDERLELDRYRDFARIGKVLLIELESLHGFEIRRKKIENLDIEAKPAYANEERD